MLAVIVLAAMIDISDGVTTDVPVDFIPDDVPTDCPPCPRVQTHPPVLLV
jgi:hypothetical protein